MELVVDAQGEQVVLDPSLSQVLRPGLGTEQQSEQKAEDQGLSGTDHNKPSIWLWRSWGLTGPVCLKRTTPSGSIT